MKTSASSTSSSSRHRGFTLTELLIVIVLIVIILGIAIPTLSVLTGSRSTESAKNQLAAMVGRARGLAVQNSATIGVAIFIDPVSGQTDMALVQLISLTGPTSYQAWTYYDAAAYPLYENGILNPAGGSVNYQAGDVVFRLADSFSGGRGWSGNTLSEGQKETDGRKTVKTFVCTRNHVATGPPGSGNAAGTSGGDNFWNWMPPGTIDLYQGQVEQLPKGVAVELINDSASTPTNAGSQLDQYVHTGVILFDPTGKLLVTNIAIVPGSSLYTAIVPQSWLTSASPFYMPNINSAGQLIYSNIGVAIYDSSAIVDQAFYSTNTAATAADLNLQMTSKQTIPTLANKTLQDSWVSNNAQLFFVSRDSGVLQKAE